MNQYTGIYRRCELWFIRRELEQFGLQPLEGKIIMFLQDNQCTQEDIGAHFDLYKGRIARSLSELEEKGLVRRLINEKNKRQKFVSLTVRPYYTLSHCQASYIQAHSPMSRYLL